MKRALAAVLIFLMVPLFLGIFCPCAKAAEPVDGPSWTRVPCHGCCDEIAPVPDMAAEIQSYFSIPYSPKNFHALKALSPGASQDIAINRRAYVPAGDEPFFLFSPQPLYLSFQVFRI